MPTSISAFPIQQEYPRNLPAASFPGGDDVLLIDGPTNGTRALPAVIFSQIANDAELNTALKTGSFYF